MISIWQLVQLAIFERLCICQEKPGVVIVPVNDEIHERILSMISIGVSEEERHCCTRILPWYPDAGVGFMQVVLQVWQAM